VSVWLSVKHTIGDT